MHAHPVLAGLLGFIPGVGAMYNGQFVKALAHVLIFAVFVSLSDKSFVFGLLVAAWVFYQVFDAAQTAKARRDGLPLPNPFGLNDLGTRLGMAPPASPYAAGFTPPPGTLGCPGAGANPNPGQARVQNPGAGIPSSSPCLHRRPMPAAAGHGRCTWPRECRLTVSRSPSNPRQRHPFGAIVLIVIGLMLLLHTLGIFEDEWIGRAWPLIIIGVGAWLLYRRTRDLPRGGAR